MRLILALTGAMYVSALLSSAQQTAPPVNAPQAPARLDMEIRADFFAAIGGDEAAFARAMARCEELLSQDPNHAGTAADVLQQAVGSSQRRAVVRTRGWLGAFGDKEKAAAYFTRLTTDTAASGRSNVCKAWLAGDPPEDAGRCVGCH
jgi:hypothetical protein